MIDGWIDGCWGSEVLVKAIHSCGVKFPEIAHSVVLLLMDFLGTDGATGVINFVRCVSVCLCLRVCVRVCVARGYCVVVATARSLNGVSVLRSTCRCACVLSCPCCVPDGCSPTARSWRCSQTFASQCSASSSSASETSRRQTCTASPCGFSPRYSAVTWLLAALPCVHYCVCACVLACVCLCVHV